MTIFPAETKLMRMIADGIGLCGVFNKQFFQQIVGLLSTRSLLEGKNPVHT
jgi:hypothetical protein